MAHLADAILDGAGEARLLYLKHTRVFQVQQRIYTIVSRPVLSPLIE